MQPLSSEFREHLGKCCPDYAAQLIDTLENTSPSVSIRLNPRKMPDISRLDFADGAISVPWCDNGYYLPQRPDFTHDPALHQGGYYVQDASSMIIAHVVRQLVQSMETAGHAMPLRYLDACAAPGGKTTAATDALPAGSLVVANEYDFRRAEILKENVLKWGYPLVAVSRGDTARFRKLPEWFDIVAADVPCSGEGMMRKDETARVQWSRRLVDECAARQREILLNLWETLRPGGFLIYSTCTFNTAENEENVTWLIETLGAEPVNVPLPEAGTAGILVSPRGEMRFVPGFVQGEGLFMAVLRKSGDSFPAVPESGRRQRKDKCRQRGKATADTAGAVKGALAQCRQWVAGDAVLHLDADSLYAIPADAAQAFDALRQNLDLIHQGVELGTVKGKSVVPAQGLALSAALNRDAFPMVETDLATALAYLKRESLQGFDAPRGHVLLTYGALPLGFANNLGNRANNLYPSPWRILH